MQKKHNQHQHPPHHHHHDLAHVLQGKLQSLDLGASICQARSSPPVYNHAGSLIIIIIIVIITHDLPGSVVVMVSCRRLPELSNVQLCYSVDG